MPRSKVLKRFTIAPRRSAIGMAASLLALTCVLAWSSHGQSRLPRPGGEFAVGVTSSASGMLPVPGPPLKLELPRAAPTVDLWYPAEAASAAVSHPTAAGVPADSPSGLVEAPLAPSSRPWPVLVYIPGWEGTHLDNVALIRELVSRGFVIAALRYGASGQLPEGPRQQLLAMLRRPMDFSSPKAAAEALERADERVRERAADASAALDRLTELNARDPAGRFTGHLDLQRVGFLGFSLGGAVAVETCRHDRRCKSAVNLDGWLFGDAALDGIDQPYLLATGDYTPPGSAELDSSNPWTRLPAEYTALDESRSMANFERHGGYLLVISGASHENFTDSALRTRLRDLLRHEPAPRRTAATVNDYVLAFFRKTLLGEDPPLLQPGHETRSGIELRRWPSPE